MGTPSHSSSVSMHATDRFWKPVAAPDAGAAAPHRNLVYVNGHSRRTGAPAIDTITPLDVTCTACRGSTYVNDLHSTFAENENESALQLSC